MSEFVVDPKNVVPSWTGWNSRISTSSDHIHKVWYMPQINQSPIQHAVVAETLNRSLTMAREAGRETIAVTYDLAIAKMALQIEKQEAPKYDAVFINLDQFHVELTFFKAIGKNVDE